MDASTFADHEDPLELLRCAQINFASLGEIAPALGRQPIYILAKSQLDAAILKLEEGERG